MNKDDLKKYSVIVGGGSGCLFQPMSDEYTYILTAKHIFFETKQDGQGQEHNVQFPDGTQIDIKRCEKTQNGWDEKAILFVLQEGETYFPHKDADIAILKITPVIKGYECICANNQDEFINETFLCGFPYNFRNNSLGDKYSDYIIERFIATGNKIINAQVDTALTKDNISGTSGGGILSIENDYIQIIGIQSKMANATNYQAGQVAFVPISYCNEIVQYTENIGKLSKLYPPYLKKFDFLLNECFALEVDSIDESKIQNTRTTLRNKAYEITKSDITPIGIKELFKERLLINEKDSCCLSHKKVWISWLEFLVIMNLMKYEKIAYENLSDIFNSYRLKYSNADEWTEIFRGGLLTSDYIGLKDDSTVVVNTRNIPKTNRNLIIPKGVMPNHIGKVYDKRGFRVDIGVDPYTSFCFVHLDYFKTKCIIEKLDEYENLSEVQQLEKLKEEYNELFS